MTVMPKLNAGSCGRFSARASRALNARMCISTGPTRFTAPRGTTSSPNSSWPLCSNMSHSCWPCQQWRSARRTLPTLPHSPAHTRLSTRQLAATWLLPAHRAAVAMARCGPETQPRDGVPPGVGQVPGSSAGAVVGASEVTPRDRYRGELGCRGGCGKGVGFGECAGGWSPVRILRPRA